MEASTIMEPPETPAHIFALRAFKTAIFGTPAPGTRDQANPGRRDQVNPPNVGERKKEDLHAKKGSGLPMANKSERSKLKQDGMMSPAKGILVTPGTSTTRRKTVSFGGLFSDNNILDANATTSNALVTTSSAEATTHHSLPTAETEEAVRRRLFESKLKVIDPKEESLEGAPALLVACRETASNAEAVQPPRNDNPASTDVTVDLTSPRSKSGKHWKKEYQRDHEKSKLEMRKLIRYSQIAKSYAIKRDCEAVHLMEKLENAERRAKEMECKLSDLASQLRNSHSQGELHDRLLHDLAAQTVEAVKYKQKADRYKLALREEPFLGASSVAKDEKAFHKSLLPTIESPLDDGELQAEIVSLKKVVVQVESHAAGLERENAMLKNTLRRVKEEMKKYEIRHQAWQRDRKQKDERSTAKRRVLREELSRVKEENRQLSSRLGLLGRECISSMATVACKGEEAGDPGEDDSRLRESARPERLDKFEHATDTRKELHPSQHLSIPRESGETPPENQHRDSEGTHFSERNQDIRLDSASIRNGPGYHRSPKLSHNMLVSPVAKTLKLDKQPWDICELFDDDHINPPANTDHRTSAPAQQKYHLEKGTKSEDARVLQTTANAPGLQQRSAGNSRASSMSGRTPLPPERAAAAKARLEQRSAEKRLAEKRRENACVGGKENVNPYAEV